MSCNYIYKASTMSKSARTGGKDGPCSANVVFFLFLLSFPVCSNFRENYRGSIDGGEDWMGLSIGFGQRGQGDRG